MWEIKVVACLLVAALVHVRLVTRRPDWECPDVCDPSRCLPALDPCYFGVVRDAYPSECCLRAEKQKAEQSHAPAVIPIQKGACESDE